VGGSGCHTAKVLFQKPPATIEGLFICAKMKLRAWDTDVNRWRDEFDWVVNPVTGKPHWIDYDNKVGLEAKNFLLCRFTGAKDELGLDIYENDVVNENDVPFVVKWDSDSHGWGIDFLNDSDRGGCDFEPWMLRHILDDTATTVSVVGSIFEAM